MRDLSVHIRKPLLLSTTMSTSTRFGIGSRLGSRAQYGIEATVALHDDVVHTLRCVAASGKVKKLKQDPKTYAQ